MNNNSQKNKEAKQSPASSGFFIAAWLWVVGMTFFYLPIYYGEIPHAISIIFKVIGWIALIFGVLGMMIETSKVLKHEAFSYWGASLAFFIPLLLLHLFQIKYVSNITVINIIKSLNVILFLVGSGIFLYGISYFFNKPSESTNEKNTTIAKQENKKSKVETTVTIFIVLISIITAIIQLTTEIIKIRG
ncbi:hypothetical protein [Paenibacillus sp. PL2-23]|uniref:hypothetical protein n=1 Tax=Paenibacillus sp. PL2-23 TaxID=2100729 RepID=UPI0030FC2558